MSKAKAEKVILVNSGACAIYIDRNRVMPGEEYEVTKEMIELDSIQFLISRGEMVIKNDVDATAEIVEKAKKSKKASPDDGKTKAQLEDGGEF
ncbi:MAG: hypothetical protein ACI4MH_01970 [Candidatus Coproplasma sp.]